MELARRAAREADALLEVMGGYDDAERSLAGFFPSGWMEEIEWPLAAMVIRWNSRFSHAGHRDILGSLMALGFKREVLGDILVYEDHAICFVHESVADYIAVNLQRVGSATVSVSRSKPSEVHIPEPDWDLKTATVASLRLDAVAAAAFQESRGLIQQACAQGLIKKNHIPEVRPDVKLEEGDVLSFRGHGRAVLYVVGGTTKKNRIHIEMKCTK
jgi:RNA-binding protein YlmH